jgi:short-subunit dehydrogenase
VRAQTIPEQGVMDAETVARLAVQGLLAGRRLVIPGLTDRLLAHSVASTQPWTRVISRAGGVTQGSDGGPPAGALRVASNRAA